MNTFIPPNIFIGKMNQQRWDTKSLRKAATLPILKVLSQESPPKMKSYISCQASKRRVVGRETRQLNLLAKDSAKVCRCEMCKPVFNPTPFFTNFSRIPCGTAIANPYNACMNQGLAARPHLASVGCHSGPICTTWQPCSGLPNQITI